MSLSIHLLKSPYESLLLYKYYLLPSGRSPSCFLALLCSPLPWVFKKYIYIIWKAFSSPVLPIFYKTSLRISTHTDLFSPLNPFELLLPNQNLNIYCLVLQMFLPCTFTQVVMDVSFVYDVFHCTSLLFQLYYKPPQRKLSQFNYFVFLHT